MRRAIAGALAAAAVGAFCAVADEPAVAPAAAAMLAQLPEVIARRGGDAVLRSEVGPALLAEPARRRFEEHPEELLPTVRRLAEQKIAMKILLDKLRERGIAVDDANAKRYLERHTRRFGATPAAANLRRQLEELAATPQFQLKAALHRYFEETAPREVAVGDLEIEQAYRLDQKRFLKPPRIDCGVIAIRRDRGDAEAVVRSAVARLRQGEDFVRVAAEVDPEGAGGALPPPEKVARLAEGEVAVFREEERILVVMLRRRTPASYIPLAEVAPLLEEELSAALVSRAMERLLAAELAAEPIRFAPEVSPPPPSPAR